MMAGVQQDVRERVPHLARAAQHVQVEALGEHWPAPMKRPVQGACDPGSNRFHPAAERTRVAGLDEQMCVRMLEREVDEPAVAAVARRREAPLEGAHEGDRAEGRKAGTEPERHVGWKAGGHAVAPTMRHGWRRTSPASCTRPATAPSALFAEA